MLQLFRTFLIEISLPKVARLDVSSTVSSTAEIFSSSAYAKLHSLGFKKTIYTKQPPNNFPQRIGNLQITGLEQPLIL